MIPFRPRPLLLAAVLLLVPWPGRADVPAPIDGESPVYPRNAPGSGHAAVGRSDDGFPLWSIVIVALVLAAGGYVLVKRGGFRARTIIPGIQHLVIEETRPLGNKQFLAVATHGDRRFLLAVCPGRIDLLSRLDDVGLPAENRPPPRMPRPDAG